MSDERTWAIHAGRIHTLDPGHPRAECLAVRGDRILTVGSRSDVEATAGVGAEWVDLRPATVVPGFTDSHVHLIEWALGREKPDLTGLGSMEEALERVREEAGARPEGAWVEFQGWDPSWRQASDLETLDRAAAGRAVALIAHDLHSGWLNSEAMRRLSIDGEGADPPGGTIERGSDGRPTGVLKERALDRWYEGRPRPDAAERKRAVFEAQRALHSLGVTSVHSVEGPDSFGLLQGMEQAGELKLRVLHHLPQRFLNALLECGIRSGFGGARLKVGGIKMFTDGALGSRTAWMLEPYGDAEGCGICRLDPDGFARDVARAAAGGLASTIHAIGDAAIRMTLDALEAAPASELSIPHRIEHLQCVHPDDLPRAARAGIVASMQPSHLLTDRPLIDAAWGPRRARGTFAFRSLLDVGTVLAFGSDAPVEAADPREGFYAAMARRDRWGEPEAGWHPEERLTGAEVLEAYTVGPAHAAGDSHRRGRLAPGYDADFAAWDIDLVEADSDRLLDAGTVVTVVAGELVWDGRG